MKGRLLVLSLVLGGLVACAPAASDSDGEIFVAGPPSPAAPKQPDAVPVVVDTDLAPDDLAAIALLVRHPGVEVVAVTVPQSGQLNCNGLGVLTDLFAALETVPPPVACGRADPGPESVTFPLPWTAGAINQNGLPTDDDPSGVEPVAQTGADFIARLASRHDGLHVVALGPLTEVATTLRDSPDAYTRLAGIITMAGSVSAPSHADGVAEWNAAADPGAFAEVVAGPVPVTVVPDDPVPRGAPSGLAGPVVGGLGRVPGFESPAYWDLATAGIFLEPGAATTLSGTWSVDATHDRGRLRRTGEGPVHVVTALDAEALDELYAATFR